MDRRTFNKLTGLAAIGALSKNVELGAEQTIAQKKIAADPGGQSAFPNEVVLEDEALLVAFDVNSGALTRLERTSTHWTIQRRPELGVSFRLLPPLPTVVRIMSSDRNNALSRLKNFRTIKCASSGRTS